MAGEMGASSEIRGHGTNMNSKLVIRKKRLTVSEVPQGSVFMLLLFILFSNDLDNAKV